MTDSPSGEGAHAERAETPPTVSLCHVPTMSCSWAPGWLPPLVVVCASTLAERQSARRPTMYKHFARVSAFMKLAPPIPRIRVEHRFGEYPHMLARVEKHAL